MCKRFKINRQKDYQTTVEIDSATCIQRRWRRAAARMLLVKKQAAVAEAAAARADEERCVAEGG